MVAVYVAERIMKISVKQFFTQFGLFLLLLLILYFCWLPFSGLYLWLRLKTSYLLLNLFGFYPKFISPVTNFWNGEYFSFLPFLALMITTYKKKTLERWKYILFVMIVLIFTEIIGRFFSELTVFYPDSKFIDPIAIFLLATARPALPFLFWLYPIIQNNNKTQ